MDVEINEVQEIIKNLESGGELSIKEGKYLKVAKLCAHLAAENVALKATSEYDYLNDQIEYWKNKSINITEQRNELDADMPPLEHENVHYADAAEMEIAALRQRIAELESRTVKLPKKNIGWGRDEEDCWNNAIDACAEVLAASGIKVEAE